MFAGTTGFSSGDPGAGVAGRAGVVLALRALSFPFFNPFLAFLFPSLFHALSTHDAPPHESSILPALIPPGPGNLS